MAKSSSIRNIFLLLFVASWSAACGKQFKSASTELSSVCAVSKVQSATSVSRVDISKFANSSFSKASSDPLTGMVDVRVDAQCLQDNSQLNQFLGIDLLAQNKLDLIEFFTFTMDASNLEVEDIKAAVEANECVTGVADSGVVYKSQVTTANTNDSQRTSQEYLTSHDYWPAYNYFFGQNQITEDVRIAIIDTGIDYSHEDLSCNMWPGNGVDIVNNDNDPQDDDPQGHGTHVAGIIGACSNNGVGIAGIMGNRVQLMGVKTLDANGAGTIDQVTAGIDWAVENGADIINLSLEAPGAFTLLEQAIQRAVNAGVVVVGAAGNGNIEITPGNPVSPGVYAGIQGMISVGSIDSSTNRRSSFSNYSAQYVEIAAVGARDSQLLDGINSTRLGGGYTRIPGTSQAAPIVAGGAGLIIGYLKSRNISYTPGDVEAYIRAKGSGLNTDLIGSVAQGAYMQFSVLADNLAKDYENATNSSFQICP